MSNLDIDIGDKVLNKKPVPNPLDKTALNADRMMLICKRIIDGTYRKRPTQWSNTTRPTANSLDTEGNPMPLEEGEWGYNISIKGIEICIATTPAPFGTWYVLSGMWGVATRPTGILAAGSNGFNTDVGQHEYWDGSIWRLI